MLNHPRRFAAPTAAFALLASCISLADTAAAQGATNEHSLNEITLESEVRMAFYEKPPRRLRASMRAAVDRECRSPSSRHQNKRRG